MWAIWGCLHIVCRYPSVIRRAHVLPSAIVPGTSGRFGARPGASSEETCTPLRRKIGRLVFEFGVWFGLWSLALVIGLWLWSLVFGFGLWFGDLVFAWGLWSLV